ncbi:MAG: UDP-glucose/GDP-mannose dehydrogenase family protein [Alphaproteobacteria bacterium]|nr:UDP-glucose/GDP-mannose dehydrogenase family protein [Alphaproteobacteria bacterium]
MKIIVLGTGYVGLVSGVCFAAWGHDVVCVDKDASKLALLRQAKAPFFEPGLAELIKETAAAGNISFASSLSACISGASLVFVAVGTPPSQVDGAADLSQVFAAAAEIANTADAGTVVVMKSTVPVGTGDKVQELIATIRGQDDVAVISNPEFLREGCAIADFMGPDRVVVGTENTQARRLMLEAYKPLVARKVPFVFTQRRTSELIKYASNAFLAAKITFINEMSDLCEKVGADISDLALGMGLDGRIGPSFLNVGPGYGGSCFPKDTLALLKVASEAGVKLSLVKESVAANQNRKSQLAGRLAALLGNEMAGKTIAVLGLSFKANTDDIRESPALTMIADLQAMGAKVRAHDPAAMPLAQKALEDVVFCADPYACAEGAAAMVVVTEWPEFKQLDFARLRAVMRGNVILDLRNLIDAQKARYHGFVVGCLGRPAGLRQENGADAAPSSTAGVEVNVGSHA